MVGLNNGNALCIIPLFQDEDRDIINLIQDKMKEAEENGNGTVPPAYTASRVLVDLIKAGMEVTA